MPPDPNLNRIRFLFYLTGGDSRNLNCSTNIFSLIESKKDYILEETIKNRDKLYLLPEYQNLSLDEENMYLISFIDTVAKEFYKEYDLPRSFTFSEWIDCNFIFDTLSIITKYKNVVHDIFLDYKNEQSVLADKLMVNSVYGLDFSHSGSTENDSGHDLEAKIYKKNFIISLSTKKEESISTDLSDEMLRMSKNKLISELKEKEVDRQKSFYFQVTNMHDRVFYEILMTLIISNPRKNLSYEDLFENPERFTVEKVVINDFIKSSEF